MDLAAPRRHKGRPAAMEGRKLLPRTRDALMRAGRAVCERMDPAALAALAALPERIGGAI